MGGAVIARHELVESMRGDFTNLGRRWIRTRRSSCCAGSGPISSGGTRTAGTPCASRSSSLAPGVSRVRYPGLAGDPGHRLAAKQMDGFGALVTFDLKAGLEAGTRFADAAAAVLAGGQPGFDGVARPRSCDAAARGFTPEQLAWSGIGPGTCASPSASRMPTTSSTTWGRPCRWYDC